MSKYNNKKNRRVLTVAIAMLLIVVIIEYAAKSMFPLKYKDIVFKYAMEFEIDPYLVFAIMKAESSFNPKAVSKKGAVGLMQIAETTGKWGARSLNLDNFSADDLYDPDINIRIGCWYLAYLADMFNGDLTKVLAAYNAGPTNVKKWLEDDGKLVNIGHAETLGYVMRVEKYYDIYKALYSDF